MSRPSVDLSLSALFNLVWKNRVLLIVVAVITMIASSLVSLLLTEYYKSTVILYPARTNSLTLNESGVKRGNISDFGEEEEAEQLLQIIGSDELRDLVINHNDLYAHYEVDRSEKHARSKIRQIYRGNVNAKRTKYNAVEISVMDEDANKASVIANSISAYVDTVKNRMIADRARESMHMINQESKRLQGELDQIKQDMDSLHALGVVGVEERGSLLQAFGEATSPSTISAIKRLLDINRTHGDEYDALRRRRDLITDQIARFRSKRNQFLADVDIDIPQKFVVDQAFPADKKAYPVRWLIVAASTFSVLVFAMLLLIIRDNYRSFIRTE